MYTRVFLSVEEVDVSAVIEQAAEDVPVASDDGQMQRGVAFFVGDVDQGSIGFEEHLDALGRRVLSAVMQCRFARSVDLPHAIWLGTGEYYNNTKQIKR